MEGRRLWALGPMPGPCEAQVKHAPPEYGATKGSHVLWPGVLSQFLLPQAQRRPILWMKTQTPREGNRPAHSHTTQRGNNTEGTRTRKLKLKTWVPLRKQELLPSFPPFFLSTDI